MESIILYAGIAFAVFIILKLFNKQNIQEYTIDDELNRILVSDKHKAKGRFR